MIPEQCSFLVDMLELDFRSLHTGHLTLDKLLILQDDGVVIRIKRGNSQVV